MKILIVKLSSLGDLFHALPAIHNIKVGLEADMDWVVQEEYVDLVNCFDDVDRVIPFSRKDFFGTMRQFIRDLRTDSYDCVLDFQGLLKSCLVSRLAKSGTVIGPSFCREGSRLFYSDVAGALNKERHAVNEIMDIVSLLKLDPIEPEFPITFPDYAIDGQSPRIAVLPVSRWPTKDWPAEYYAQTINGLLTGKDASIYLLGGPGDIETCNAIEKSVGGKIFNMAGKTSLVEMGSLLQKMDLLISNDSGPVHMAAALQVPCLVIFGPTDPDRTGPFGDMHRVITSASPCRPCFSRKCKSGNRSCLLDVKPQQVIDTALDMLSNLPR